VRGDPRITILQADREARQRALMSAYALAKPAYQAGRAVRRLTSQLRSIERLLQDTAGGGAGAGAGAPAELAEEVDSLQAQLQELKAPGQVGALATAGVRSSRHSPQLAALYRL